MLLYRRAFLFNSGCRRTTSGSPLPTDCNACLFFKRVDNGECVEKCPEEFKPTDNTCVPSESIYINYSSIKPDYHQISGLISRFRFIWQISV